MDGQPRTAARPASGLPRPTSRLPLPSSTASRTLRPSPSRDRLQADPGLDHSRLRRPSRESLLKKPTPRYSTPAKVIRKDLPTQDELESQISQIQISDDVTPVEEEDDEARGRSLSDRTIETLSSIPPSPASVRQSSFFNGTSPIRSPSRTTSNVSSYSRSPSRSSSGQASDFLAQPVPKLRLPSQSRMSVASVSSLPTNTVPDTSGTPTRLKLPSSRQSIAIGNSGSDSSVTPKKTIPGRTSMLKAPAKSSPARSSPGKVLSKPTLSDMGPPERPLQVRKTRKPQTDSPSSARSPSAAPRNPSRYVSAASLQDELSPEQQAESEMRKVSKSSNALRDTIAKAKAARKAAASKEKTEAAPQVKAIDPVDGIDSEDPFNQLPKGSDTSVLRKRVESARKSGILNVAALSLKEIPKEVIDMYVFDPDAKNWFENVDLVKFIAADNELQEVADATFPDIDLMDLDPDSEERGPQFGALESLDLHGNLLKSVPMGIRRLHQLRFLNLSNNTMSMDKLHVVLEIASLTDLKLANNQLSGPFFSEIGRLSQLESLDLRGNDLTSLPEELKELTSLKTLDVGGNQLTSLPFEALSKLPLRTLNAPKNSLQGTLIPESVNRLETLQSLNIAGNSLKIFAANEALVLPSLQNLYMGVNRMKRLPCVSSWQSLLVLSAEDNRLTQLPEGFVKLKSLKSVDFTANNFAQLDEKIGLMASLSSFKVGNNPLRDRKLLSMGPEEIIQRLRNKCEPEPQDTDDEGSVATQFTLAPETPELENAWKIKPGGIIDRSYSDLTELGTESLELISTDDVRCLYLQHNELPCFPTLALGMLAQGLVDLDLSYNPLDSSKLMSSSLELPRLQTLNLSAAGLTSLDSLLNNLQAPSLNLLDVANNRLKGALPHIRETFPGLKTLLASDNQFESLEFEAVQGLQVLDVSNNNIDYLPPKIGLLGSERNPRNWGNGTALRRFEVAGNRFRVPRWQIVAKGTDEVLEFLLKHIRENDLPEWEREKAQAEDY
ncbi:Leucine-rich repeat typical subtype [Penicillium atrosanguineum]|uniref:Leucine-rich repeat typical subtype n=1 Tax=Penicillium atrosanguineum TaxID=1132637 RepID=A0A9W9U3L7_9EURO|nr:Leucine-rich repeat typical subtype [Penicillium atrosanguineum]KAJ5311244.1 Leucine-rich repeat typical subtype [Penicillium atrosanguineum]